MAVAAARPPAAQQVRPPPLRAPRLITGDCEHARTEPALITVADHTITGPITRAAAARPRAHGPRTRRRRVAGPSRSPRPAAAAPRDDYVGAPDAAARATALGLPAGVQVFPPLKQDG